VAIQRAWRRFKDRCEDQGYFPSDENPEHWKHWADFRAKHGWSKVSGWGGWACRNTMWAFVRVGGERGGWMPMGEGKWEMQKLGGRGQGPVT
jgi:hypothetical protein